MPARRRAESEVVPDLETGPDEEALAREADRKAAEEAVPAGRRPRPTTRQRRVRKARKRVTKVQARTLQAAEEPEEARRRVAELEHELETLDDERSGPTTSWSARSRGTPRRRGRLEQAQARLPDPPGSP